MKIIHMYTQCLHIMEIQNIFTNNIDLLDNKTYSKLQTGKDSQKQKAASTKFANI